MAVNLGRERRAPAGVRTTTNGSSPVSAGGDLHLDDPPLLSVEREELSVRALRDPRERVRAEARIEVSDEASGRREDLHVTGRVVRDDEMPCLEDEPRR